MPIYYQFIINTNYRHTKETQWQPSHFFSASAAAAYAISEDGFAAAASPAAAGGQD